MSTRASGAGLRLLGTGYRVVWTAVAAVTYAVGIGGVALGVPLQAAACCFLVGALLGGSFALSLDETVSRPMTPRRIAWIAAGTGCGVLAALGLAVLLGLAGVGALAAVHLMSPAVWGYLWRLRLQRRGLLPREGEVEARRTPGGEEDEDDVLPPVRHPWPSAVAAPPRATPVTEVAWPEPIDDPTPLEVPDHLSDEDLCLAWQSSLVGLQHCRGARARLRIVEERQACLDELERRNPQAVQEWLEDGARAASAPTKYLSR